MVSDTPSEHVVSCMYVLKSVIEVFKPEIYKLIHYVLYEHLSDMVAMVKNLIS